MNILWVFILGLLVACGGPQKKEDPAKDMDEISTVPEYFELRTYYCNPGKLEDLMTRFNDHTMALFEKHGMTNMAYWLPLEDSDNTLVYLLGYPDREGRDRAWEAFMADPEWNRVWEESKADGPLVDSIDNVFLTYTDYSPRIEAGDQGPRIFSLRTYYTHEGKLEALHRRFREHTLGIFEDNGITNIGYFNLEDSEPGADNTLMYFISFPDTMARKSSWEQFSKDPTWVEAYENSVSEGPLVDSITAQLLVPTDFSPLK